ncbi:MAG TPA: LPS export ABC transporter periplasmic protein LptC [Gemmatimonadaceae bacterium]|nr:LPS export ABC transporter periplasmic protein LptC [Gemmatimonadaceae bacterium]
MTRGLTVAILSIVAGGVALGCNDPAKTVAAGNGTVRDSADQLMYGVRASLTNAGVLRGLLTADSMLSLDAATRFELRGVRIEFTSTLGRPLGTLTAGEATYWLARSTVETRGKVTVVSDTSGRRIEGAWVRYNTIENQLASDSPFVAEGRGGRLTGVGFTSDPGLFTVKCVGQCTGSLRRP